MNHKNRYTNEILAQSVEVCNACHLNFVTTAAGDKHRKNGKCLTPKEAKLIKLMNQYGSIIYKARNDKNPRWSFQIVPA
jgi:hypothetical protein